MKKMMAKKLTNKSSLLMRKTKKKETRQLKGAHHKYQTKRRKR